MIFLKLICSHEVSRFDHIRTISTRIMSLNTEVSFSRSNCVFSRKLSAWDANMTDTRKSILLQWRWLLNFPIRKDYVKKRIWESCNYSKMNICDFLWFSLISEILSHQQHLHRDDQRFVADVVLRSSSTTSHPEYWIVRVRIRMIDNVLLCCQSVLMISFETWRHVDDVTCKLVRFIFLLLRSIRLRSPWDMSFKSESEHSIDDDSVYSEFRSAMLFSFFTVSSVSHWDQLHFTLSSNCVQVQILSIA